MPRPRSAPATPNPFAALASQQSPGSPGSRRQKKAERAKEHRASASLPVSPALAASLGHPSGGNSPGGAATPPRRDMGLGPSVPQCEEDTPQPASQHEGQPAAAAQQPSGTPGSAAGSRPNAAGAQGRPPPAYAPLRPAGAAAAGQPGGVGKAEQLQGGEADVDGLMSLLLGSSCPEAADPSPARSTPRGSTQGGDSGSLGGRRGGTSAAASPAPLASTLPRPQQQQPQQPAGDWQLAAAIQQEEVAAALAATHGSSSGAAAAAASQDDWHLAATLQQQEDAAAAAAEAAAADAAVAAAEQEAARDEQLARQWQEEEDARVAAALAAEEEAAASEAATTAAAASSANFWSALHLHDPEEAPDGGMAAPAAAAPQLRQGVPVGATAAMAGSSRGGGAALGGAFPSLQAASAGGSSSCRGGGPGSDSLRQALLRDHRGAAQRTRERGSGVRLLHRADASGSPAARPPLHPGGSSWLGSPASEGGGLGAATPGGLPPLRLDDGGQLLEDDLDYQLLLRPEGVSEAAAAAAARMAQREAAVDGTAAGGPAASAEALRAMMDASSRGAAGGSRPGSAGGAGAWTAAGAGGSRPGSAGGDGWEGEAEDDNWADVHDVDTKSLRRLVEDMKRRGWRMQPSGGGHIKCERPYQDADGATKLQVYFLCSTPSDVAYIHNVKAAVKRFDRQLLEVRAAAAAAIAAVAAPAGK